MKVRGQAAAKFERANVKKLSGLQVCGHPIFPSNQPELVNAYLDITLHHSDSSPSLGCQDVSPSVQVMRDHGPVHLGDVDHAISKFTAEMRQHGAPWQVEGGTKRSGWSLLKVFCLREIGYGSKLGYKKEG